MKKFMLLVTSVMLAASLAACTPTSEKNKEKRTAPPSATQESVDGAAEKEMAVNNDPTVTVCVYSIKDDKSGLKQNMDALDVEELDPQLLIDKMAELEVIESGITVEKFEQKGKVLTLELSSLKNAGDKQLQTAIANTFLQNYEADDGELILSAGGQTVSDGPLTFNKEYKTMK